MTVIGKGKLRGEIIKHLAPSTNLTIIRRGKLAGRATLEGDTVVVPTSIRAAAEKQKTKFMTGDIGFLPLNGALYLFTKDTFTPRPMNHIGRVDPEAELLRKISRGDTIVFEVMQRPTSS